MFSRATLRVADRLVTALMTLAEAVAIATEGPSSPKTDYATVLLARLAELVSRLLHLTGPRLTSHRPPRPSEPSSDDSEAPTQPKPARRPSRKLVRLPRRPGWIVEILPETAPAIAAELQSILADPALQELLADDTLERALRPLLRGLNVEEPVGRKSRAHRAEPPAPRRRGPPASASPAPYRSPPGTAPPPGCR